MSKTYILTDEEHFFDFLSNQETDQTDKDAILKGFKKYYSENNTRKIGNDTLLSTFIVMDLIIIVSNTQNNEFIKKTIEFHKASSQGWKTWFSNYNDDQRKAEFIKEYKFTNTRYRAIAAKFWWLPVVISVVALVVSLVSYYYKVG